MTFYYSILTLLLVACQSGTVSEEVENKPQPKAYRQTTYKIDTIAGNVVKELVNFADVVLSEKGEIEAVNQTDFSFEYKKGQPNSAKTVYTPESSWFFSEQSKLDVNWPEYLEKAFRDTLIIDGSYGFLFNEKSQLKSFMDYIGGNMLYYQINFTYDNNDRWTQIKKGSLDERSGNWSYEITSRELMYESAAFGSSDNSYLTINGEDIFSKEKLSIVDYYVLLRKANIFQPENYGGAFDIPNGFFQYEDEGTGEGLYKSEIALFKAQSQDILAINSYAVEPMAISTATTGGLPKFYFFNDNGFEVIEDIFPEMSEFISDQANIEEGTNVVNYFKLPQMGLSIKYFRQDKVIEIPFNKSSVKFEIKQ